MNSQENKKIKFKDIIDFKVESKNIQLKENLSFEDINGLVYDIIDNCDMKDLNYISIEITKRFFVLDRLTNVDFEIKYPSVTAKESTINKFNDNILKILNSSNFLWDYVLRELQNNSMYVLFENILEKTINYESNRFGNKLGEIVDSLTDVIKKFDTTKIQEMLKDLQLDKVQPQITPVEDCNEDV